MNKKYIVRLTDQERDELAAVIKRLKGTSQKVRRARILSKADADGPNWTDHRIAEALGCRRQTVENVRQRLVERGFREVLEGRKRETPLVERLLSGGQEARIIATRQGPPPPGFANWTLRLLLNTHLKGAFYESFAPARARQLVRRIEFCYTPKLGSWLNIAEYELSCLTSQCVAGRRFGDVPTLRVETTAWSCDLYSIQRGVDWQMRIDDARCKLNSVYPKITL
jgi:Homeodomain-like domain